MDATNIPWLEEVSVETLRSYFPGYQVFIDNDVNVVALLEAHYGAAKGCRNAMYITVSTGVGSGIIIDNKILRGSHGYAGEIGSMIVSGHKKTIRACTTAHWSHYAAVLPSKKKARGCTVKLPQLPCFLSGI